MSGRLIEWGTASEAFGHEQKSGDLYLVKPLAQGALVAVADGVGHGEDAEVAARIAIANAEAHACEPLESIMRRCHLALRGTRGVVLSLASFDPTGNVLNWLGVGTVEGVLLHQDEKVIREEVLLVKAGLVGDGLPPLYTSRVSITRGDLLIMTTDGIGPGFSEHVVLNNPPQEIAEHILTWHRLATDDALVLAVRYINE